MAEASTFSFIVIVILFKTLINNFRLQNYNFY
nr:MAG TPA: hypothetical protein [Caudoviricetes sp.]